MTLLHSKDLTIKVPFHKEECTSFKQQENIYIVSESEFLSIVHNYRDSIIFLGETYANTIHENCGPYSEYKIAGTKDISISVRNILNINCDKANDIPLEPRIIAIIADSFVGLFVTHLGA
uniref:Phosphotriesterase-related protein n=1 Tax=Strongyloides venezuelensis TaxID=75913 RepID=A0A0K0G5L5_STRVS